MVQGRGGRLGAPDRCDGAGAAYSGGADEVGELFEPGAFRGEVIAHELLHLQVPNHERVFKALMRAYLNRRTEA